MRCKRLSTRWRLQVAATTEAANALIADALEIIALLNGSDRIADQARSDAFRRWRLEV
jgi:hypothetical protein